jgi:predicted permease
MSPVFSKDKFQRAVYHYSLTITNFSYMAFVLADALLGNVGLANVILFCIPVSLYTYSVGFSTLTGGGSPVKKLINPITVAMALGMVFGLLNIPLPEVAVTVLDSANACVGPLSMLLTGFVLSGFGFKKLLPDWRVLLTCVLRLVVLPALVFFICKGLDALMVLPDAVYPSAVLVACMPCGLNVVIFPKLIGKDCDSGARIALYSQLISCFTIPLWMSIIL